MQTRGMGAVLKCGDTNKWFWEIFSPGEIKTFASSVKML